MDNLKVVPLSPNSSLHIQSLYDRILFVIDEYCSQKDTPVTLAEILGTLEFVKREILND